MKVFQVRTVSARASGEWPGRARVGHGPRS